MKKPDLKKLPLLLGGCVLFELEKPHKLRRLLHSGCLTHLGTDPGLRSGTAVAPPVPALSVSQPAGATTG